MGIYLQNSVLKVKSLVFEKRRTVNRLFFAIAVFSLAIFLLFSYLKSGFYTCSDDTFSILEKTRLVKNFNILNVGLDQKIRKVSLISSTSTPDLTLGLSNIPCIQAKKGMIFEFSRPDYYGFWMKDMLINLDIAWLDDSYSVVYLLSDVSPETYPNILKPESSLAEDEPIKPAMYVIEMKGGEMKKLGIKVGTKLVPISQN